MQLTPNLKLKKPEASDAVNIVDLNDNADVLDAELSSLFTSLSDKVDKVPGKGLSTNDYTTSEKTKLSGIAAGAQVNPGAATTSAAGLMSAADKSKLDGVASGANNYTHPSSHPPSIITQDSSNRFVTDTEKAAWNAKASTAVATASVNGLMSAADKATLNAATNSATASTLVKRDSAGRMKAAAPVATDDVARKADVDAAVTAAENGIAGVLGRAVVEQGPERFAILVTGQSWDSVISGGFYRCTNMTSGEPPWTGGNINVPWAYCTVINHGDAGWTLQTATNYVNSETWQRSRTAGEWQPWKLIRSDGTPVTRINAGRLEFLDGGVWQTVGANRMAIPSNLMQYQDSTARAFPGSFGEMLVGRFIPKCAGIMRLRFEYSAGSVQGVFIWSIGPRAGDTYVGTVAGPAKTNSNLNLKSYIWDLPLGSAFPSADNGYWGTPLGSFTGQPNWTPATAEFYTTGESPCLITINMGVNGGFIRDLQVCYDIVTP
jgi:hypothetical protein